MNTVTDFPGNSGRYYGLQTVEPTPGQTDDPIIGYGTLGSGSYLWGSSDTLTIISNQAARIIIDPLVFPAEDIPIGWIIDMRGGDQVARSLTSIELKSQENLSIQFVVGETAKTFRVGQVVNIFLNLDRSKNMTALVKNFIQSSGLLVVDVISHNGEGTYPQPATAQQWLITVDPDFQISGDYMLARVTNFETPSAPGQPYYLTFQAYQSFGSGTYNKWTIGPQWSRAYNFVRNPTHAAYDASIGPQDEHNPAAAFYPYTGKTTTVNVVTNDTPLLKSGYTQVDSNGRTLVYEDEFEINRPYLRRQITVNMNFYTATYTVNVTYDEMLNPTYVYDENVTDSPVSSSHTFSDADFILDNQPGVKYFAGSPAVYSNGELVSPPSPAYYLNDEQADGSTSYLSYQYSRVYGRFLDRSVEPPAEVILIVSSEDIYKGYIGPQEISRPNPDWFYYVP